MGDHYIGTPEWDEFYAELDRRHAVVFVHPLRTPEEGMPTYGFPRGFAELVFDTTRAIGNMLYYGIPHRFPNIRWIMSHAGGVAPVMLARFSRLPLLPGVAERLPDGVEKGMAAFYYDVAQSALPTTLRALQDIVADDHILFGTDYPFSRVGEQVIDDTIEGVDEYRGFSDPVRQGVYLDNALKLFPRLAAALAAA